MNSVLITILGVDALGTVLGIYAMKSRALSGKFTAISAGVMVGVALFWIFPDMTQKSGWVTAVLAVGSALAALLWFDRFIYPVCPCCSHSLGSTNRRRHLKGSVGNGTLIPLVIAICLHNLFDGWTAAAAGHGWSGSGSGIALGLIAHKIPEALVFGLMLRGASTGRNVPLLISVCLTSLAILAGGATHAIIWTLSETTVIAVSLALACGSFLFAGGHMFVRQQRHVGTMSALAPLILGVLVSAGMEQAVSAALRH
jgi:zinc transporter ZupT